MCTADGSTFEIMNIVPYIQRFGRHPVTGAPLKLSDLIKLNVRGWEGGFRKQVGAYEILCSVTVGHHLLTWPLPPSLFQFHKNADGEYVCPVLHKVFTDHTHIVAVRPSGNVYCYEVGGGPFSPAEQWRAQDYPEEACAPLSHLPPSTLRRWSS